MQTAGASVLRAVSGRGLGGRAARVPVARTQDGPLHAGAAAPSHAGLHRRRAHHAYRRRIGQRGE